MPHFEVVTVVSGTLSSGKEFKTEAEAFIELAKLQRDNPSAGKSLKVARIEDSGEVIILEAC